MGVDDAYMAAQRLFDETKDRLADIETEQDARFQLIDRFLVEVLGWDHADVRTEPHTASGYTDYLLMSRNQKQAVIEAKRTGNLLLDTVDPTLRWYKVGGPALKSATDGIDQGVRYSIDHGVNYAILTTGLTWIAFRPLPGAGISFREGRALVFPNLMTVLDNFAVFYDMFAKESVVGRRYTLVFAKDQGLSLAEFEPLITAHRKEDIHLVTPSALATDLEPVFRKFFGAMSSDVDREMLIECFVETRESKFADASLEKMVRSITTNIEKLHATADSRLADEIRTAVESGRGETVIIVGSPGAGKSTFVERFFDSILEDAVRTKCLVIRVDLIKSPGDLPTIASWLTIQLKDEMESLLYGEEGPSYDDLQGLYFREYQRWMRGTFKPLYDSDKNAFKIKFSEFLHEQVERDPYTYMLRLLDNIVKSRKLLPCLIFDNGDLFDLAFQEAVFQYTQAVHNENNFTFIVVPVTDRSFWRLAKAGPFQTYESKKFYLPVPPTKEVMEKRVAYLTRRLDEDRDPRRYLLSKGIRLTMESLKGFAACLEEVFLREDFVARRISWLANNNIKRSLALTQKLITSPHFMIDDLIKAFIAHGRQNPPTVNHDRFMRALLQGNYNAYQPDQDQSEYILNVFEISPHAPTTPLLALSILKMLIDRAGVEGEGVESYISVEQCGQYLDAMRITEAAVHHTLQLLLNRELIQPYDASEEELESGQRVAITHAGRMHYEMATIDPAYMREMAYATPVRSVDLVEELRSIGKARRPEAKEWKDVTSFVRYCLDQDAATASIPKDDIYDGQRQLRFDLRARWADRSGEEIGRSEADVAARAAGGWSQISAVVKWYSSDRGFGFVEGGLGDDVFLHRSVLQQAEIGYVSPGDSMVCDIVVGPRGKPQVIAIHSIQAKGSERSLAEKQEFVEGTVEFYNAKKGYGFIKTPVLPEDVFVASRILDEAGLRTLTSGGRVRMKIQPGRMGRGFMASSIELIVDEPDDL